MEKWKQVLPGERPAAHQEEVNENTSSLVLSGDRHWKESPWQSRKDEKFALEVVTRWQNTGTGEGRENEMPTFRFLLVSSVRGG